MRLILFVSIAMLSSVLVGAQGFSIKGNIKDADYCVNKPLKGAIIALRDLDRHCIYTTKTDSLGDYYYDSTKVKINSIYAIGVYDVPGDGPYRRSKDDTISTVGITSFIRFTINFELQRNGDKLKYPLILFAFKSSSINRIGNDIEFCELLKLLRDNPTIVIQIDAHCSPNEGSNKAASALSYARAKACCDYLVSQGVDSARVRAKGWGYKQTLLGLSAKDIAKIKTKQQKEEAYQSDRRAEFRVVSFDYKPKNGMSHLDSLKAKSLNDAKVSGQ